MAGASVIQSGQNLNYNGLQVTVEKRLSHSISVIGFYVWSKSLGTASLQTTGNIGNSAATMRRTTTTSGWRSSAPITTARMPQGNPGGARVIQIGGRVLW
jgi:hypothetical protein